MKRKSSPHIKVVMLMLLTVWVMHIPFSSAQSKKDLETKRKKLQNDIKYSDKLLKEARETTRATLKDLAITNIKITKRKELIATINTEVNLIGKEVKKTNASITSLQNDLVKLKQDYAKMIYFAYRNQDAYTRLMYVFASKDFNQAYLRLKYFQQYSEYRKKQADMIVATQQKLNEKKAELEKKKEEKSSLLGSQNAEKELLNKEKAEQETVVAQLRDKEKQLKKDIEKKKADDKKLKEAIDAIIAMEIEKARKIAEEKAKKEGKAPTPVSTSKVFTLTREGMELSNSFEKNQGKLPWPVIKGDITGHFGVHPHPVLGDIEISNNGIDILTSKGALVRAVFEGEVTGVVTVPGSGKVLIIRHGEYLSVYTQLNEVFVKQGEKVTTKQNIATVLYDETESKTEVHLEIWKGKDKLDPEDWLFKN